MNVDEEVKKEDTTETDQAFIDSLMNQYNKPAQSVEQEVQKIDDPAALHNIATEGPTVDDGPKVDDAAPFGRYVKGPKKGQPKTKPGQQPKQVVQNNQLTDSENANISGMLIDGALFLTLIDLIFPLIISIINNRFTDDKINPEQLQMTKEQKNQLTPVCDKVMNQLSISGNPMVILLLGMFAVYGLNFMAAKMESSLKN